ncbi:hypothetical protein [Halostagnicola sp. A-GB9-2]|uniref:DUF7344 domain-containing protein n=1 Tax=Halostagnicola sp. A-GB9-2 TaxID=3048066 RepID=UPI0024BFEFAF|nr:hypothetical protein [Halostagnicola sp. A-GB9-2]MDJ1433352.1 hypothetical protein [Halostagnicola sp. A-GB9-2]
MSTVAASDLAKRLESSDEELQTGSIESLLVDLHHRHLPVLSDAGLIAYDTETRRATAAVDPADLEADIQDICEFSEKNAEEMDALFDAVADPRRRYVLESLAEKSHAITVESVSVELSQRLRDDQNRPVSTGDWKRIQGLITHTDLPLLADAGLIEYDPDANLVRSQIPDDRDDEAAMIVDLSASA